MNTGNLNMVTRGANLGRIGVITNRKRPPGSFDMVHVKDAKGNSFAIQFTNIFVIGKCNKPQTSLPQEKGSIPPLMAERNKRLAVNRVKWFLGYVIGRSLYLTEDNMAWFENMWVIFKCLWIIDF